ncbi:enolase C-terminal domain-like protein [Actinoplanes regularis]|uniref:L-fuconate dehydratase n=1 Tax=Actinoplanes regularis TaxID=52697 RepID=A0A239FI05_9ACTN|nr:enolase C-terminal domain-like protein [Actinoplanes regularis]GIE89612.1 mandelate racemase [Actinoplanes regularis]SNS56566.1 L-fuconate dehydratase [Actinoplanes regularis]
MTIAAVTSYDIRFPTSRELDGSDAMNPDPDYSAAYVVLRAEDGSEGHGFTFTIGRGNEVCRAALDALAPMILGQPLDDLGELYRRLTHDSQIRWLGPEKGVMHLAAAALVNAAWDLRAKRAGLPLWALLSSLSPDELVDLVDWRYLTDALTPAAARDLLLSAADQRETRASFLKRHGYPAYTTSAGWLGYPDEKIERLAREAVDAGFQMIKLKVGADLADDVRRLALARAVVGPGIRIAVDANQRWDVPDAIAWTTALAKYDPWWIEEPTSPDDVLGHAAIRRAVHPVRVATGEHVANRVVFKQLLQAGAIDVVQLDACRVAGVNENVAILLLAAAYGKPVCPHAGGVGLCEVVRHFSFFDFVAVSGSLDDRVIEYVDHLHEHFVDPATVVGGRYLAPAAPGFSTQMRPESLARYAYPEGRAWS